MQNMLKTIFRFLLLFVFGIQVGKAQQISIPVNSRRDLLLQSLWWNDTAISNPFGPSKLNFLKQTSPLYGLQFYNEAISKKNKTSQIFAIRPLLETSLQKKKNTDKPAYTISSGAEGIIAGEKLSFQAALQLNNSSIYSRIWNDSLPIVEHHSQIWFSAGKNPVFISGYALANYSPWPFLNLEAGYGKHFWGDGMRSLFLSDNASPYPYAKIEASIWKIHYIQLYSFLRDINFPDTKTWDNKYASSHILKFAPTERLGFYAFESVVWSRTDSLVHRNFDVQYLNPVVFFRPVEYQLSDPSPDNVLLGLGFEIKPLKNFQLYGQILLDEFNFTEIKANNGWWANKYAIQAGGKYFDFAGIKNWIVRAEINLARPYTWSHESSMKNYGHQGQALAHPLGANFAEACMQSAFYGEKINIFATAGIFQTGLDTTTLSYGQNIYKPYTWRAGEYNQKMLQGSKTTLLHADACISIAVIKKWDLHAELKTGFQYQVKNPSNSFTWFVQAGLKTILFQY